MITRKTVVTSYDWMKYCKTFFLIVYFANMGDCQQKKFEIGPNGIDDLRIGEELQVDVRFKSISKDEEIAYIFKPSKNSFRSFAENKGKHDEFPFEYEKIFVAIDSSRRIKKIICFMNGSMNTITRYLNDKFRDSPDVFKSFRNGEKSNMFYQWQIQGNLIISLGDFSKVYNENVVILEIFDACDVDFPLFSVLKLPDHLPDI